jgi:hypothetical protein
MKYFKEDEFISYSIKNVNGFSSSWLFKARIKKLCKDSLDRLKEILTKEAYEDRLSLLEYMLDEFSQFKFYVREKEKVEEESEWGPEKTYRFIGFDNPKFSGTKGEDPYHKDTIEHKAEDYAKAWLEAINDTKSKIEFLINQIELLPEPKDAVKDKNTIHIFYSWQSDNSDERRLIWKGLRKTEISFKDIGKTIKVDSDNRDTPGSQDIPNTLFRKIENSDIFIADVNLVNKSLYREETFSPNPNVLIELGYAASKLGWERIILVFNTTNYRIEDLPFDIRQRTILWYTTIEELNEKFKMAIGTILKK